MSNFLKPQQYGLTEVRVNDSTGQVTISLQISVTVPQAQAGSVLGAVYDSSIPGWRVLIATPTGAPAP